MSTALIKTDENMNFSNLGHISNSDTDAPINDYCSLTLLSYNSFTAYAVCFRVELNQYSSSLVAPLMCIHLRDGCMTVAVCIRITFRSVHVAQDYLIMNKLQASLRNHTTHAYTYGVKEARFCVPKWIWTHTANVTQMHCTPRKGDVALYYAATLENV